MSHSEIIALFSDATDGVEILEVLDFVVEANAEASAVAQVAG